MTPAPSWEVLPFAQDGLPLARGTADSRYLVVHLPAFRLERCGWQADDVVVLVAERQGAVRVVALTPAACEAGLAPGMVVAEARALVVGLVVEPLDELGEAADRTDLCRAFERFGDRVASWGDDAVVIEIATSCALFGGERSMLARVRERADDLGHICRLAVADHPLAAWALARHADEDVLVEAGQGAAALAPLPLKALDPSDALRDGLLAVGVRTVGALAGLDPASVAGRFGAEGFELHRVARGAAGGAWTGLPVQVPLEHLSVPVEPEASDVDGVMAALQGGLARLRDQLAAHDLVAARIEVRLELSWGAPERLGVRIARPTRDPDVLARLLRSRLERVALEGPVGGLLLHAAEVTPDGGGQQDLLDRREPQGAWSELLARLGDVLGTDAVVEAVPVSTWRPESGWVARPLHGAATSEGSHPPADDPVERQEGPAWCSVRPRPTLLRHPPLPLHVREDDTEQPLAVRSRHGWSRILRARGPEHLTGEWWRPDGGFSRAYWVVGLPEGVAWVFRERQQWFLHGWFD